MKVVLENIAIVFNETYLLKQINFCLAEKSFVHIQGNNGVGKTTLIKIMAGMRSADRGQVKYFQNDTTRIEKKAFQNNLGLCVGQKFLCLDMTLEENLSLYHPSFKEDAHVLQLLDMFSLQAKLSQQIVNFSKGEIQKAALCRALLHDPETLFLDEPFEGLDKSTQKLFAEYIAQQKKRKTLLLCSHVDVFSKHDFDACWDLNSQ